MTAPALMTEAEAAEALRVCPRTLRKARQQGRLTYVLIGRAVRYTMSDLEQFIDRARQDNPPCQQAPRRTNAKRGPGQVVPFTARH